MTKNEKQIFLRRIDNYVNDVFSKFALIKKLSLSFYKPDLVKKYFDYSWPLIRKIISQIDNLDLYSKKTGDNTIDNFKNSIISINRKINKQTNDIFYITKKIIDSIESIDNDLQNIALTLQQK